MILNEIGSDVKAWVKETDLLTRRQQNTLIGLRKPDCFGAGRFSQETLDELFNDFTLDCDYYVRLFTDDWESDQIIVTSIDSPVESLQVEFNQEYMHNSIGQYQRNKVQMQMYYTPKIYELFNRFYYTPFVRYPNGGIDPFAFINEVPFVHVSKISKLYGSSRGGKVLRKGVMDVEIELPRDDSSIGKYYRFPETCKQWIFGGCMFERPKISNCDYSKRDITTMSVAFSYLSYKEDDADEYTVNTASRNAVNNVGDYAII